MEDVEIRTLEPDASIIFSSFKGCSKTRFFPLENPNIKERIPVIIIGLQVNALDICTEGHVPDIRYLGTCAVCASCPGRG